MSNARDTAKNLKTGLNVAADGTIIDVQKNGTSVATIGNTGSAATLVLNTHGSSGVGLFGSTNNGGCLLPADGAASAVDNAKDLGRSDVQWRNLYLSNSAYLGGGAYIGGTTAANKLEDYEEGTWTPTVGAITGLTQPTVTAGTFSGSYTKVGSVVVASYYIGPFQFNSTGAGSTMAIKGFPFNGDPNRQSTGVGGNAFYYITFARSGFVSMRHYTANEFAFLSSNNGGNWGWESCSAAGTGSHRYIIGSMTYFTAS